MTDPSNPLPGRAVTVLEHLRARADADGCSRTTRDEIAAALGMARSTVQLATADLMTAELLIVEVSRGRMPNVYCVQPTDRPSNLPTDPMQPTDATYRPTLQPTDRPVSSDAPEGAHAPASAGAQFPLPTPIEPSAATLTAAPLASAPTREQPTDRAEPTDAVPVGRLAVAAAMESAAAAGRSIEAGTRGRIGSAAQRLAGDGEEVATILAAARRVGEGGYADLYTAVRAVKEATPNAVRAAPRADRTAELMPTGATVGISPRIEATIRRVRGTWGNRSAIDAELWEEKLGLIQERFLIAAVDAIAQEGGEFAPTWGKVWKVAHEVGQPVVLAERQERARLREVARSKA